MVIETRRETAPISLVDLDVDVQVDVDVDVDEWSDLTLAHERLDVYRRAIEFLADAMRFVSMLSRLCR